MPYASEHAVRLNDPDKYESIRREVDKFGAGIDALWGITVEGTVELQAIRFDADRYSIADVHRFVKDHNLEPIAIEPVAGEASETPPKPSIVERLARLFRAGYYPTKGVEITEHDLDSIVANSSEVPIVVEHKPTLLLGKVAEIYRKGKELWGRLHLKPEAAKLIEDSFANSLSVAINLENKRLQEVSLVQKPQVADAHIFTADEPVQDFKPKQDTQANEEVITMSAETISVAEFREAIALRDEQIAQLKRELLESKVSAIVRNLTDKGHLLPANAEMASTLLRELMTDSHLVQFNGESVDIAELFLQFVQSCPPPVQVGVSLPKAANLAEPMHRFAGDLNRMGISEKAQELLNGALQDGQR